MADPGLKSDLNSLHSAVNSKLATIPRTTAPSKADKLNFIAVIDPTKLTLPCLEHKTK